MRQKIFFISFTIGLIILGILWVNGNLLAQDDSKPEPPTTKNLPFIDRDGDGVNDLLQHGWGLRILQRNQKRKEMREKLEAEGKNFGSVLVDTDNDGTPDTPLRDIIHSKMNEMVDTDRDGVPDKPLRDYLRERHQTFDRDGDGIPDITTLEEIRSHMKEMQNWRKDIQDRIKEGLSPFTDEDGDGIPDNLPPGLRWRGRGPMHGNPIGEGN